MTIYGHIYKGHNYLGNAYIGHNYVGHNYVGIPIWAMTIYMGYIYKGHNYVGRLATLASRCLLDMLVVVPGDGIRVHGLP